VFHNRFSLKSKTFCFIIMSMSIVWKGHPRNDLYCVGWDSLTYLLILQDQEENLLNVLATFQ